MPQFLSLSELLIGVRKADDIVAFEQGKAIDWQTLSKNVAALCWALKKKPRGQWLLTAQSSYAFAVGLLALWQTDNIVLLPPNLQPGTLAEMSGEFIGIVNDSPVTSGAVPVLPPLTFSSRKWPWKRVDRQNVLVKIFTSGSTGIRKGVPKTLANLEEEIAAQEAVFGARLKGCSILSTVSHQHIYGLLFKVLWPLSAGRPFISETPFLWEELLTSMTLLSPICLVSSPAHLDYACAVERKKNPFSGQIIFSSGAPLKKQTAKFIREHWRSPVIEIFGSTESGGVGWRSQTGKSADDFWTPLPGVSVSVSADDHRLRVLSPFATVSGNGWCDMGDRADILKNNRFLTHGRIDRIVKIAGKRLSLDDMEIRLNRNNLVNKAILTIFDGRNLQQRYVGAVIVLSPSGKKQLRETGHLAMDKKLRTDLKSHFDGVTLPRYFIYVDDLPINSQGKITKDSLDRLFKQAAFREDK